MRFHRFVLITVMFGQAASLVAQLTEVAGERGVTLSGDVKLDNGSPPPASVMIKRVCGGRTHVEGFTDQDGHYAFRVEGEQSSTAPTDASESSSRPRDLDMPFGVSMRRLMPVTTALRDCEIQAILPGYRTASVSLGMHSTSDDPRIGTLVLRPLSRADTLTISMTTAAAPANARKAYEKGVAAAKDQKWDVAARELAKSVKEYPKFASAWYELGIVKLNQRDVAEAAESWKQAVNADPKFVKPYEMLTIHSDQSGNWADSLKYSSEWIRLDPDDFPSAYLYKAIASARVNRTDDAERSARDGIRIDKDGKVPRLRYVLGLILDQRQSYGESAECFREYLKLAPNANDAAVVRAELSKLEQTSAALPKP